jgi:hypothetical protein
MPTVKATGRLKSQISLLCWMIWASFFQAAKVIAGAWVRGSSSFVVMSWEGGANFAGVQELSAKSFPAHPGTSGWDVE